MRHNLRDQNGKATIVAMLASLASLVLYLKMGRAIVLAHPNQSLDFTFMSVLLLIGAFTIGCVCHMLIIGEVSAREYQRQILLRAKRQEKFATEVERNLGLAERQCCIFNGTLDTKTMRALSLTRRISAALGERNEAVQKLIQQRKVSSWYQAGELLDRPLDTDGDCCQRLILGDPIDPIDSDEVVELLDELFRDIDIGLSMGKASAFTEPEENDGVVAEYPPSRLTSGKLTQRRPRRPTVH